jgi:hypothetical protein
MFEKPMLPTKPCTHAPTEFRIKFPKLGFATNSNLNLRFLIEIGLIKTICLYGDNKVLG